MQWLDRAQALFPYERNMQVAKAYYFTSVRLYTLRKEAITTLEQTLKVDPFAVDLWTALAAYKIADGDDEGAELALNQVVKLRPGTTLEKMP